MKKVILGIITLIIAIIPFSLKVQAKEPVNIYLFRGEGCPHCEEFLEFIDNLDAETKSYFNLVEYEVWNNKQNNRLMQQVASVLGDNVSGVPYIIIGTKTFPDGYSASMDEEIIAAIKDYYNSDIRYDVMDEIDTTVKEEKTNPLAIALLVGIIVIGGIGLVIVTSKEK